MKNKAVLHFGFFLLLAASVAILADLFQEVNDRERGVFRVSIPRSREQTETIDIASQGMLKYYLQPGQISLYVRGQLGRPAVPALQVAFSGLRGYVSQGSKRTEWKEVRESDLLQIRDNGAVPVTIEVDIPRSETRQYQVGSAVLDFVSEGKVVSTVKIAVINSRYAEK